MVAARSSEHKRKWVASSVLRGSALDVRARSGASLRVRQNRIHLTLTCGQRLSTGKCCMAGDVAKVYGHM